MTSHEIDAICVQLAELQVRRKFYIGLINQQTNAAKALVRRGLGWMADGEEGTRSAINARAARIVSAALAVKDQKPEDEGVAAALGADLLVVVGAIQPLEKARHAIELDIARAARKLPVAQWVEGVRGFGEKTLGVIIGETGNLSNYATPDKVWKRLGLAPHEGKAYSTWRRQGGLTAEEWMRAGYAPARLAQVFACLSDPLSKAQIRAKGKSEGIHGDPAGPYGEVYVRRQFRTDETHSDWTPAHKRADALRVMTKKAISDLWSEWRLANPIVNPDHPLPAADLSPQGAPPANVVVNSMVLLPGATPSAAKAGSRAIGRVNSVPTLPGSDQSRDPDLREVA